MCVWEEGEGREVVEAGVSELLLLLVDVVLE